MMLVSLLWLGLGAPAGAQDCQYGSEQASESLARALTNAPSCSVAADKLQKCAWGSSADAQFASIVIDKCEKAFLPKLTPQGKERYKDEMYLCGYEYARQKGTMYISAAALCKVNVAVRFSAKPEIADQPAPRASFDCKRAESPLEKAICSDQKLGHADIVLGRSYNSVLRSLPGTDKGAMIRQEKEWLSDVVKKCGAAAEPLPPTARDCIQNEFELRFTELDACGEGGPTECLHSD